MNNYDELNKQSSGRAPPANSTTNNPSEVRKPDSIENCLAIVRTVADWTSDCVFIKDTLGRYRFVNARVQRYLGRSAVELMGKTDDQLFPEDFVQRQQQREQQVLDQGEAVEYEERFELGGKTYIRSVVISAWKDEQGHLLGVVGFMRDITPLRQQAEALELDRQTLQRSVDERNRQIEESDRRFAVIADTTPVAMLISRAEDGKIVFVNRRLTELYGDAAKSFLGRSTLDFYVNPDEREDLLAQIARQGRIDDHEVKARRADGSTMWISISAQPIEYQGEACILAVLLDVTASKEAQETLMQERRRLRRLLELHEQEHRLVAYDIHDGLVQEMTGTVMYLESLGDITQGDSAKKQRQLNEAKQTLRNAVAEARRLINGLRPPALEEEGLVYGIQSLVQEIAQRSDVQLQFEQEVHFHRLEESFETAVYRIVQECLNNVRKHSQSKRARVELKQVDHQLVVRVQDWGVGFDPDRIDPSRFGLLGVRERVRILEGTLHIDSRPGQGTVITVELPIAQASEGESGQQQENQPNNP